MTTFLPHGPQSVRSHRGIGVIFDRHQGATDAAEACGVRPAIEPLLLLSSAAHAAFFLAALWPLAPGPSLQGTLDQLLPTGSLGAGGNTLLFFCAALTEALIAKPALASLGTLSCRSLPFAPPFPCLLIFGQLGFAAQSLGIVVHKVHPRSSGSASSQLLLRTLESGSMSAAIILALMQAARHPPGQPEASARAPVNKGAPARQRSSGSAPSQLLVWTLESGSVSAAIVLALMQAARHPLRHPVASARAPVNEGAPARQRGHAFFAEDASRGPALPVDSGGMLLAILFSIPLGDRLHSLPTDTVLLSSRGVRAEGRVRARARNLRRGGRRRSGAPPASPGEYFLWLGPPTSVGGVR